MVVNFYFGDSSGAIERGSQVAPSTTDKEVAAMSAFIASTDAGPQGTYGGDSKILNKGGEKS